MVLEILGNRSIKADESVQVYYKTGEFVIYCPKTTEHLILNPDSIISVTIGKKARIIN